MELLQLKYFCDAARSENFSKTAKKFGVPPSDISQSIKRLEGELGRELFERRANRIILSEHGRAFSLGVERALGELERSVAELSDDPYSGKIRILAAAIRRIVMQTVEKFKRLYPDIEVLVSYDRGEGHDDFDIAVSDADFPLFGTEGEHLMSEEMALAVNRSNPLALCERVDVASLEHEAFVSMGRETSLSRTGERICKAAGFSPNVSIRSADPFYVRRCVELSLGVAIVPSVSWRGLFNSDVVMKPIAGAVRDTYVYVNKRKYTSERVLTFKRMLSEECIREMAPFASSPAVKGEIAPFT